MFQKLKQLHTLKQLQLTNRDGNQPLLGKIRTKLMFDSTVGGYIIITVIVRVTIMFCIMDCHFVCKEMF